MPVVEWGDFASVQQGIVNGNNAIQGAPAQNVPQITGAQPWLTESGIEYFNFESAGSGNVGIDTNFPDANASQASQQYLNSGGQVTPGGAAAQSGNVVKVGNYTLTQKTAQAGTGAMSVGALLSVNLPTAAAAIAPIAGVALGAGLYSLNPELWGKISRALVPFCYKDTELLPVVADENGNTYFPKEAIDAVKNVVSENVTDAASAPGLGLENSVTPYPFGYAVTDFAYLEFPNESFWNKAGLRTDRAVKMFIYMSDSGQYSVNACSEQPFRYGSASHPNTAENPEINRDANLGEYNGKQFYSAGVQSSRKPPITSSIPIVRSIGEFNSSITIKLSYAALYGDLSIVDQPGVTRWSGPQYPLNPEGIGVVTRISEDGQIVTTNPYYPVTMPVGDPGVSPNPDNVPQPGTNPEINPAINPWIPSSPSPSTYPEGVPQSEPSKLPNPVPDTDPNLDPNANPSEVPDSQPDTDPVQSTKPTDEGTAPLPVIPIIPALPSSAAGLLHVYNPSQAQIDAFGSWLWTTFSGDLIDTISKLFNDPMDAVIGLHELYATPAVSGSSTIRAGFLDSGVSSNVVGSRYTSINCGSIVVQEHYQNYLDYSPYTKCYIYLPFVGIVPVLADDIIGNAVNVTYHVDSYTGCCIAVVTVARSGYSSTVYQFEGNCAVEIPITSGYQSTLMGALIGAGATALTGNPHAGIAAANMGRASLGKNDVSHSGSFGSSYGAMGAKIPYIIVKRPTQKSVVNYNQDYGFPAHKRVTIGACSGYLRAREVHVISPTATDDEKARIEELLKKGVFVK